MRTLSTLLLFLLFGFISFAQIHYEKGYIISDNNQRVECFIKNMEWKYNPTEISYKLNLSDKPKQGDLNTIREFGIYHYYKFVSAEVKIDRSVNRTPGVNNLLDPVWRRERLFLKVLLEGKAKLYCYDGKDIKRFFYAVSDTSIRQLVYMESLYNSKLLKNTSFRQQLLGSVKIPEATENSTKDLQYTANDLENYFKKYNRRFGDTITDIIRAKTRSYFNLKITPGLSSSSATMNVYGDHYVLSKLAFNSGQSFRIGLESELIIPFNQYRWGILFEPTFQNYKGDAVTQTGTASVNYSAIELPIGIRYYISLNDDASIYFNGLYVPGFAVNMNSKIDFYNNSILDKSYDVKSTGNIAFGAGIQYKRLSFEGRYFTARNIYKGGEVKNTDLSTLSVVLGYKLIKTRLK